MSEYRTPRERQAQAAQRERIRKVLDQAVADGVSCKLAMRYGESQDVVETWIDRVWNGLRDNLTDERPDEGGIRTDERLTAIAMLLEDRMDAETRAVLRSVRDVAS